VLSREDFVFTIGYDGPTAVVDKEAKKKYGKFSTRELAEKGFFRAACSSAVYSKNPEELGIVAEAFFGAGNPPQTGFDAMERLFGVTMVDVKRFITL